MDGVLLLFLVANPCGTQCSGFYASVLISNGRFSLLEAYIIVGFMHTAQCNVSIQ